MDTPELDRTYGTAMTVGYWTLMVLGILTILVSLPLMFIGLGFVLLPIGVLSIWFARWLKKNSAAYLARSKALMTEMGRLQR